ncbi:MAG: pentapeptide repeat-containing protein [Pirellulales bacterium]|nr:pentapeptide repeat-containing protein [Pirellulales bacterium]
MNRNHVRSPVLLLCALSALYVSPHTILAGPPQPGPQAPQSKYLIRRISDTPDDGDIDDVNPKISGTSLVWQSGPRGDYDSQQVKFYNPSLSHPLGGVGLGSKMYTPISAGGNYHLSSAGDRVMWMEDIGGQADIFSSNGVSIANLSQSGVKETHPRSLDTRSTYLQSGNIVIHEGNSQHQVVASPGYHIGHRYAATDDYLVYLERPNNNVETAHLLKAYHFDTQTTQTLTYHAFDYTVAGNTEYYQRLNFAIDGSTVYYAASYDFYGPAHDDHEIYTYDLSVGDSSLTFISSDGVDDIFPQAAGGRAAWYKKHIPDDPNSSASIILHEGGTSSVLESDGGVLWGLSDSRVVFSNSIGEQFVLANGIVVDKDTHLGTVVNQYSIVDVSGQNYALTRAEHSANHSSHEWEVFAGYFIGPGAVLTGLDLSYEDFSAHSLRNADMRLTNLEGVLLDDADLRGADLTGAVGLDYAIGPAYFSHETIFPTSFNPHEAGWTFVSPEPSALLMLLLGSLFVIPGVRRRHR